ncbi:MAG: LLM class F420-dependent oxidoreductase [bacterium]|nr:LLM class F420-dependent oxidoreductase [Deltaproteobacteria bacterium]MCP4905045.1 LLM class F420-dependent oxidoreductase [bacterium]
MKLGIIAGYSPATMSVPMDLIQEAERLGFTSVWTAEAWGSDAVSPAAWILAQTEKIDVGTAIMQMPGRTPAMTAMTAMTLYALSGGRFILGLGPSGPQVVEGWHGVAYGRPLTRTKEYVAIIRTILERKDRLQHEGYHYQIPFRGEGSSGLGKPLKSILHGDPALQIYTASISPNGMECAGEVSDGVFPVWMNPERYDLFEEPLEKGFSKADGDKSLDDFEIAPFCTVIMGDDLEMCRTPVKNNLALYIGGMGARDKNFYNDYAMRLGYEEAAVEIQNLFLDGKKGEAAAAVPDALVDDVALVGSADRIRDRLQAWKAAAAKRHVGSLLAGTGDVNALRVLAEEVL